MRPDANRALPPGASPREAGPLADWLDALPAPPEELDPTTPRGRIFAAAREAFAERGFEATTTRTIADRADVNLAMVHYYFGSKEALYRQVLGGEMLQLFRGMAGTVFREKRAPADRLLDILGFINRSLREDRARLSLLRREMGQGAPHVPHVIEDLGGAGPRGFREVILATIEDGQQQGQLVDVHRSAILAVLLSSAYGLLFAEPVLRVVLDAPSLDEDHWDALLANQRELLRRAIVVPKGKEPST